MKLIIKKYVYDSLSIDVCAEGGYDSLSINSLSNESCDKNQGVAIDAIANSVYIIDDAIFNVGGICLILHFLIFRRNRRDFFLVPPTDTGGSFIVFFCFLDLMVIDS